MAGKGTKRRHNVFTMAAPVGVTSSASTPDEYTGVPLQQLYSSRRRHGKLSVRALDCAAADVERGTNPLINAQGEAADGRAHNVHDCIDGAHFVEVNFLHVGVVDLGLSLAQRLEDGQGAFLGCRCDARTSNNLLDLLQTAMGLVLVRARRPHDSRRVTPSRQIRARRGPRRDAGATMTVLMLMRVRDLFPGKIFFIADPDINFRRRDSAAGDARNLQARADVERGHGFLENAGGQACVQQRPQKHVAANAREAVEIGDAHKDKL